MCVVEFPRRAQEEIKKVIEEELGIIEGETTADGMFTCLLPRRRRAHERARARARAPRERRERR